MSDVVPYRIQFYGGRVGTWEFWYGPWTYGDLGDIAEEDDLPSVDYTDLAYDRWTITMSLRSDGLDEEYWHILLELKDGPRMVISDDNHYYFDTLLFQMVLSTSAHDAYDKEVFYLHFGYLRRICKSELLFVAASDVEIWHVSSIGAWYIAAPYYLYEIKRLDGDGFYAPGEKDDPKREIEA